jgi:hypothetical protein
MDFPVQRHLKRSRAFLRGQHRGCDKSDKFYPDLGFSQAIQKVILFGRPTLQQTEKTSVHLWNFGLLFME